MNHPPYIETDNSITVLFNGKPTTVTASDKWFGDIKAAIRAKDWEEVYRLTHKAPGLVKWSKGEFTIDDGVVTFRGEDLPHSLTSRVMDLYMEDAEFEFLLKFWERLQANPSRRAVTELYRFLVHNNIPIGPDGCFYAYKSVTDGYLDHHSKSFDNRPGQINEMPRNQVDDDARQDCSNGFHVGTWEYASTFAGAPKVVICKVDPADVVSVPYSNANKVRVCKYEVTHDSSGKLPSTTLNPYLKDEEPPQDVEVEDYEDEEEDSEDYSDEHED